MQTFKRLSFAALCLGILAGCALFKPKEPETTIRVHEQAGTSLPEDHVLIAQIPKAGLRIPLNLYPVLSELDVESASVYETAGGLGILLQFDAHGIFLLDESTTRTRGQYLVTYLNGRPISAWFVNRRLTNGVFRVEGDFDDKEARKAVESLNRMSKKRQ